MFSRCYGAQRWLASSPMRKTTLCLIVNLSLLAIVWVGEIVFACQVIGWRAAWQIGLVAVIGLPVAGYFARYLLTPIVNRVIAGKPSK